MWNKLGSEKHETEINFSNRMTGKSEKLTDALIVTILDRPLGKVESVWPFLFSALYNNPKANVHFIPPMMLLSLER